MKMRLSAPVMISFSLFSSLGTVMLEYVLHGLFFVFLKCASFLLLRQMPLMEMCTPTT